MKRFHLLDGMRGIAAVAVVTAHQDQFFGEAVFGVAGLAVDFFFCLSGFVIAGTYDAKIKSRGLLWFIGVRLIRLYPLYLIGIAIGLINQLIQPDPAVSLIPTIIFSMFMLPTPSGWGNILYPFDMPIWSVFFEVVVNILWAIFGNIGKRALFSMMFICMLSIIAGVMLSTHHTIGLGFLWKHLPFGLARAIFMFAIGALLVRQWRRDGKAISSNTLTLLMLAAVGCILLPRLGENFGAPIYGLVTITVVVPGLVYLAARIEPTRTLTAICGFLGATSYGVYVLHDPLGNLVAALAPQTVALAPWSGMAFVALLMIGSWTFGVVYDVPIRKSLAGILERQSWQVLADTPRRMFPPAPSHTLPGAIDDPTIDAQVPSARGAP
jgi:peptidoglycan/LPS O-acetylase OafA/YrhL